MTAPIVKPLPYDNTNPDSILKYAQFLKWKTFWEVLEKDPNLTKEQKEIIKENYDKPKNKSRFWDFIQENFFYIDRNSDSNADLNKAWVELKVSPYIKLAKWRIRAKERMVLTKINYMNDYNIEFEKSHLLEKCGLMLLIYYFYDRNKSDEDYLINYVDLFQFPEDDYEIIKNDYNTIINKIRAWKAHEISEWDTMYLWACTKAADSSVKTEQPFSNILAKPRAFSLKNSYMTIVLNEYLAKNIHTYKQKSDEIKTQLEQLKKDVITYWKAITDKKALKEKWFENYIISKMKQYYWKNVDDLFKMFGVDSKSKSKYYMLAKKMLWVNEDKIEEFEKANIEIKTIRLKSNGTPKEAMSFPAFEYMKIINQDYYDSELYDLLSESKFLFMIFKYKDKKLKDLVFEKAMFWNTPWIDLEWKIKIAWEKTKQKICWWEYDNLIKIKDNLIIHVRPHAKNKSDTFKTPNGWEATKKCFRFNQKYIKEQIEKCGN